MLKNMAGPLTTAMEQKLRASLQPKFLQVINESWKHAGHAAVENDTTNETHFVVKIVSEKFNGKRSVERHRMVYSALTDEFQKGLHALQLKTLSEEEYEKETKEGTENA